MPVISYGISRWRERISMENTSTKMLDRSLMLVTSLSLMIDYDKASNCPIWRMKGLSLKDAALGSKPIDPARFDEIVDAKNTTGTVSLVCRNAMKILHT
jgi:fumarate hydratase class II